MAKGSRRNAPIILRISLHAPVARSGTSVMGMEFATAGGVLVDISKTNSSVAISSCFTRGDASRVLRSSSEAWGSM